MRSPAGIINPETYGNPYEQQCFLCAPPDRNILETANMIAHRKHYAHRCFLTGSPWTACESVTSSLDEPGQSAQKTPVFTAFLVCEGSGHTSIAMVRSNTQETPAFIGVSPLRPGPRRTCLTPWGNGQETPLFAVVSCTIPPDRLRGTSIVAIAAENTVNAAGFHMFATG